MDTKIWMYVAYLVISLGLTVWVAKSLSRNGLVFLNDVLANDQLAKAVNRLLVVGFYLLNFGYVTVAMKVTGAVVSTEDAVETLSLRIGYVLLVLGALHLFNVWALNRYRRGRLRAAAPVPPLPPQHYVLAAPPMYPQPTRPTFPPMARPAAGPAPAQWPNPDEQ